MHYFSNWTHQYQLDPSEMLLTSEMQTDLKIPRQRVYHLICANVVVDEYIPAMRQALQGFP
jgi:hypothetical protein